MNFKLFGGKIGSSFVIIRIGLFGFHRMTTKAGNYSEVKLGLLFFKIHNWGK